MSASFTSMRSRFDLDDRERGISLHFRGPGLVEPLDAASAPDAIRPGVEEALATASSLLVCLLAVEAEGALGFFCASRVEEGISSISEFLRGMHRGFVRQGLASGSATPESTIEAGDGRARFLWDLAAEGEGVRVVVHLVVASQNGVFACGVGMIEDAARLTPTFDVIAEGISVAAVAPSMSQAQPPSSLTLIGGAIAAGLQLLLARKQEIGGSSKPRR